MKPSTATALFLALLVVFSGPADARGRALGRTAITLFTGKTPATTPARPIEVTMHPSGRYGTRPLPTLPTIDESDALEADAFSSSSRIGGHYLTQMRQWQVTDAFRQYCEKESTASIAYELIVHTYSAALKRHVAKKVQASKVDDIVQETWLQLTKAQGTSTCPKNHKNPIAWLVMVANNTIAD